MSLAYFPLYPDDFEAAAAHLTLAEDGAYNRLLRLCWRTPGCSIPADRAWVYRRLRAHTEAEQAVVETVIAEFFQEANGRLSNARLMKEWLAANEAHARRKNAGAKGGKAKALKTNEKAPSNAKALLKQPEPEPYLYTTPDGVVGTTSEIAASEVAVAGHGMSAASQPRPRPPDWPDPHPPDIRPDPDPPDSVGLKPGPQRGKGKARGAARKTRIPDNWAPSPANYAFASQSGLTRQEINHEADQFRHSAIAAGRTYANWDAAFRTWLGNTVRWRAERAARAPVAAQPAGQPRGGGLVAAGLRHIGEARGYGQPVPEAWGVGAGDDLDGDGLRLTGH